MQAIRTFNLPVVLLNLFLAVIMAATIQSRIFGVVAIAVTALLVVIVCGALAGRFALGKKVSLRLTISLIGTALLWIPVFDAPGIGEPMVLSWIIDTSLVLGCVLLLGSVIWPPRDKPTW